MIESSLKQFSVMFQLSSVLACTTFSVCTACAAAAEKYSVIPEPDTTELQQREIEVPPETNMSYPNQALAVYPEFFCFPDHNIKVSPSRGLSLHFVCPHKLEIWKFHAAVFDELKDIFPSSLIHPGGDEAPLEQSYKLPPVCGIAGAEWSPVNTRLRKNFQCRLSSHSQFILKRFCHDMERAKANNPSFK